MPYTMEDFRRELAKEWLEQLTPEERRAYLQTLPAEERMDGLSEEDLKTYLTKLQKQPSRAKQRRTKRRSR